MIGKGSGFGMRNIRPQSQVEREPRALVADELTAEGGLYHTNGKIKELVNRWVEMRDMRGQGAEHEDSKQRDLVFAQISQELDGLSAKTSIFRLLKLSISREELNKVQI
ncbi:MAG: hypothetical protein G01um10148_1046 [Parcubacteria group bacterium Gr01-1014_8]|nr:MAG: hypothetical protein G01um10148_1046 [Parcubacteria group bacterium Gr01-1014_8]